MSQPLAQNSYKLQEDAVFCVILFLHLNNTTDVSCRLGLLPWEYKPGPTSWVGGGNSTYPLWWRKEGVSNKKTHCLYSIQPDGLPWLHRLAVGISMAHFYSQRFRFLSSPSTTLQQVWLLLTPCAERTQCRIWWSKGSIQCGAGDSKIVPFRDGILLDWLSPASQE